MASTRAPFFILFINKLCLQNEAQFAKVQEAVQKDIERAFGVLQGKWNILSHPFKFIAVEMGKLVIKTSVIMHSV